MPDIAEFQRMKKEADRLRDEASKAEGARDAQLRKLKADFGCDTIEAAEELLVTLKREEAAAAAGYETAKAEFKTKWGHLIS